MKILGIDEAGRGPVIGPMTMCGYLIDGKKLGKLRERGARDSKMLTAERREALAPKLRRLADDVATIMISARDIDRLRTISNLNRIEIARMQEIINALEPDVVRIDAPEVNTEAFRRKVCAKLGNGCEVVCENFADRRYPEVGAASIIAKVARDAEIRKLHKRYGFFGSGYSHDGRTVEFLKNWIKDNKEFPDIVRKSWITAMLIKEEKEQKNLSSFGG